MSLRTRSPQSANPKHTSNSRTSPSVSTPVSSNDASNVAPALVQPDLPRRNPQPVPSPGQPLLHILLLPHLSQPHPGCWFPLQVVSRLLHSRPTEQLQWNSTLGDSGT